MNTMPRLRPAVAAALLCSCAALMACDVEDPRDESEADAPDEEEAPRAFNGTPAEPCTFPATGILLGGAQCMANLIHPELVVYAGHCGTNHHTVHFGESSVEGRDVPIEACIGHPDTFFGVADIAVCQLSEPVLDVPIVPIPRGCEAGLAHLGAPAVIVDFGPTAPGMPGVSGKNYAVVEEYTVTFEDVVVNPATAGTETCDYGGAPLYMQASEELGGDGSWRLVAVSSTDNGEPCGQNTSVTYERLHQWVDWIEETSGIDVTPCHADDGTWEPTEECGGYPLDLTQASGTWATQCSWDAIQGFSSSCGEPFEGGDGDGDADGDGSGDGAEADGGSETEGAAPGVDEGDGGCSCRAAESEDRRGLLALAIGLVFLGGRRARRTTTT